MIQRGMKNRRRYAVVLIGALALGTLSCQSNPRSNVARNLTQSPGEFREQAPAAMVDQQGVGGIVEYLPPSMLIDEYGRGPTNPFVAPQAMILPLEFVVFRVTVTDMEPGIVISTEETELRFGGSSEFASPQNTIIRFWQTQDSNAELKAHQKSQRDNLVRTQLLGADIRSGDEPVSGLLVFMGRFPDYGDLQLRLPIVNEDFRPIDYITVEMTLD